MLPQQSGGSALDASPCVAAAPLPLPGPLGAQPGGSSCGCSWPRSSCSVAAHWLSHAMRGGDEPTSSPPLAHQSGCASSGVSARRTVSEWPACAPSERPHQKRSASCGPVRWPQPSGMVPSYFSSSHTTGLP